MLRRELQRGRAENRIDPRSKNSDGRIAGSVAPSSLKSTSVPSLRPIQLRCMVRTFSGQPGKASRSRNNSSA